MTDYNDERLKKLPNGGNCVVCQTFVKLGTGSTGANGSRKHYACRVAAAMAAIFAGAEAEAQARDGDQRIETDHPEAQWKERRTVVVRLAQSLRLQDTDEIALFVWRRKGAASRHNIYRQVIKAHEITTEEESIEAAVAPLKKKLGKCQFALSQVQELHDALCKKLRVEVIEMQKLGWLPPAIETRTRKYILRTTSSTINSDGKVEEKISDKRAIEMILKELDDESESREERKRGEK